MYATVRTYEGSPDLADQLVANESEVRQLIGEIDGFKSYYLIKTGDGAVSVSVYDDQSGAEESTRAAAAWVAENIGDVPAPRVSAGEVVVGF